MEKLSDKEEVLIVSKQIGSLIGCMVLVWALFLSYKIYQNFSEHQFFATVFGIPTNIFLYLIVWKCFSVKNAVLVSRVDDEKNTDYEVQLPRYTGKQRFLDTLFTLYLIALKVVSSLFFTSVIILTLFFAPQHSTYDQLYIICTSVMLLVWTHYRFLHSFYIKTVKKDNLLKVLSWLLIPFVLWEFINFFIRPLSKLEHMLE